MAKDTAKAGRQGAKQGGRTTSKGTKSSTSKGSGSTSSKSGATPPADAKPSRPSSRVGRGTRWTEEQVKLLLDTVKESPTAKEAFEKVARELGKSTGTVQQKYYALKRGSGGPKRGRGRRTAGTGNSGAARGRGGASSRSGSTPADDQLAELSIDDLVALAQRVKGEVDRRRRELDAASKLFG